MSAIHPSPAMRMLRIPGWLESLTPQQRFVLPYVADFWLREDQRVPRHAWSYCGFICGRGWGKSWAIAQEINRLVQLGEARSIALMMQTEPRVYEVMVDFIVATSPPWFKAEVRGGAVHWPNGAKALVFTAEAPEAPRGGNFDLVWLGELVAWPSSTRKAAFDNITTAARKAKARVFWDTTSKGKNELILELLELHEEDAHEYPIIRGDIFQNEWFTIRYLLREMRKYPPGRRRDEELFGKVFSESAGALWRQEWIDNARRQVTPLKHAVRLVAIDPNMTTGKESDECGFAVGESDEQGDVYLTHDLSKKYEPEEWAKLAVDHCERGAAGIVVEVNRGGNYLLHNIRVQARERGYEVREWPVSNDKPFPRRTPGVIYVREVKTQDSKETRAYAPAGLTEAGRFHLVGSFDELETQMTTWVPGDSRSPNRLDAAVYLVLELANLTREQKPSGKKRAQTLKLAHTTFRGLLQRQGAGKRRL